ncbi:MAG: SixA phosphatase family protein [Acidimicrobiales bacterium]
MPILLVRHAEAGHRSDWHGDDSRRPLSPAGRGQARLLARALAPMGPSRILSSPTARCVETVEPLSERLGLPVEETDDLAEGRAAAAVGLVRSLAGHTVVAVSHGDVIPEVLGALAREDGMHLPPTVEWAKASTWVLASAGGRFVSAGYRDPPSR